MKNRRFLNFSKKHSLKDDDDIRQVTRLLEALPNGIVTTDTQGVSGGVVNIDFNGEKTGINAIDPVNDTDLANKRYVDQNSGNSGNAPLYENRQSFEYTGGGVDLLPEYTANELFTFAFDDDGLISLTNNSPDDQTVSFSILSAYINPTLKSGGSALPVTIAAGQTIYLTPTTTNLDFEIEALGVENINDFIHLSVQLTGVSIAASMVSLRVTKQGGNYLSTDIYSGSENQTLRSAQ